ncbi:MAG: hypothetical protein JXR16_02040 [Bermanella sp.]
MTVSILNILVFVGLAGGAWFFFAGKEKENEVFSRVQSELKRYSFEAIILKSIKESLKWNEKIFGDRAVSPVIIIISFLSSIALVITYYYGVELYNFRNESGGVYFTTFVLFSIILAVISRITTRYFLEKSIQSVKSSIQFLMLDALSILAMIGAPLTMAIFFDDVVSGTSDASIINYINIGYQFSLLPFSYPFLKEPEAAVYSPLLFGMLIIFSSSIWPSIIHISIIFKGLIIRTALSLLNLVALTLLRLSPFDRPFMSFFSFLVILGGSLSNMELF